MRERGEKAQAPHVRARDQTRTKTNTKLNQTLRSYSQSQAQGGGVDVSVRPATATHDPISGHSSRSREKPPRDRKSVPVRSPSLPLMPESVRVRPSFVRRLGAGVLGLELTLGTHTDITPLLESCAQRCPSSVGCGPCSLAPAVS